MDAAIRLTGYEGTIRQLAVDGLGREPPTLFLTNEFGETARSLILRYAGRNRVEGGLGTSIRDRLRHAEVFCFSRKWRNATSEL